MNDQKNEIEIRSFPCELRSDGEEKRTVVGTAAVFNSRTELWTDTFEEIAAGAFDEVLDNDVRALFNHDSSKILARTKSKTLKLSVDKNGLNYTFNAPNTTVGNDLLESLSRGDIDQSSFAFRVKEAKWTDLGDGKELRTILKVSELLDVSPVTYPAYRDTKVAKREKEQRDIDATDQVKKEQEENKQKEIQRKHNERERKLKLLKLNLQP